MRKQFLVLLALIFQGFIHAQVNEDSLRTALKNTTDKKKIVELCVALSKFNAVKDFKESIEFARTGISAANALNDSLNTAILYQQLGVSFYFSGSFDSAAQCYYKAISFFENNKLSKQLASAYNDLAKLYRKTGNYKRAHEFYNQAMSIYKSLNDESGMAIIFNEDGVVFEMEDKPEEAIKNYTASLELDKKLHDSLGVSYALNFLAGIYTQQKKFDEAEKNNLEALHIREALKDSFNISLSYTDLGDMYKAEGKYAEAEKNYLQSNEYAKAVHYADLISNNFKQLADAASLQGNFKQAFEYSQQHEVFKDSIYRIETSKQVEELSSKYETAKKEEMIKDQQFEITKRNYWIIAIICLLVLGFLLGFSYYRRYKLKQQAKLQFEIMKQQEFATKAVIEAEENERKRIAGDLHDGVGQLMSAAKMNLSAIENSLSFSSIEQKNNFEKIVSLIDESCNEVRTVSHNMMPNALLKSGLASAVREFVDKIDTHILKVSLHTQGLNEKTDSNVEIVLYRIIQECVNNVIKHSNANHMDISLIKDSDGISATIEDNGKGFNVNEKMNADGIGLKNIKSRIDYLKGNVEWDSAPGKGTVVAIHVPVY